ncbi:MAG: polysaccharide biosynthesis protein [Bacteroidales bacterium]|nr:polysaccharide biosynthesis protein [Bacteroidales bacterium]
MISSTNTASSSTALLGKPLSPACNLVMVAATMSTGNQIFVFDMGESIKIADLEMISSWLRVSSDIDNLA